MTTSLALSQNGWSSVYIAINKGDEKAVQIFANKCGIVTIDIMDDVSKIDLFQYYFLLTGLVSEWIPSLSSSCTIRSFECVDHLDTNWRFPSEANSLQSMDTLTFSRF